MEVRDAVEADADAMAAVADAPTDAMRALVHDRTVRVAVVDDDGGDGGTRGRLETRSADGRDGTDAKGAAAPADLLGFVSYDAGRETVHVTQLAGDADAMDRLLAEPVRFARTEGMAVELVVPDGERATGEAAERAGFDAVGPGPSFAGEETVTFRLEPG